MKEDQLYYCYTDTQSCIIEGERPTLKGFILKKCKECEDAVKKEAAKLLKTTEDKITVMPVKPPFILVG